MKIKKLKNKITLLNAISNLILQFVTIISTLIVPKLILSYFGSEINGIVSSLTQFLNYVTLLEGGVTGVIVASLFKPIVENDSKKISSILKTTKRFYSKVAWLFVGFSVILAIIYPIAFKTDFSYFYVFFNYYFGN